MKIEILLILTVTCLIGADVVHTNLPEFCVGSNEGRTKCEVHCHQKGYDTGVCHQTQMTCTCGLKRSFNQEAAEDISEFKVQPKLGRPFCIPAFCRRSCRRRGLGAGYCNPQKTCVCAI
jgi:hypothetical protein